MTVYYNDADPFVCAWLRNLIAAKLLPAGDVDERPIEHVQASDVAGYTQAHFFAGIGGWPYALQLAGWDRPVWTGSCPCQPLSGAGLRQGHADSRHLWPAFYRLISECKPPVVFGEQVASADGREWLAGIRADLEAVGYACGAADLCAAGAGAPQLRQRLFWLADRHGSGSGAENLPVRWLGQDETPSESNRTSAANRLSNSAKQRQGSTKPGDGSTEVECRWPDGASPNRRFIDGFGNSYRIPEPAIPFLDDGFPGILDQIRAAGNAIVPQVAAAFVSAYMEIAP